LFAVIVGPWLYRQFEVFRTFLPTPNSGRLLWLADYQQLFSSTHPPTPAGFFAQGLGPIVASRVGGILAALGLFALIPMGVVLAPLALVGAVVRRRDAAFRPFFVYGIALFLAMSLLFSVLVTHGTFIHSAAALVPHAFLLAVAGVAVTTKWVARHRARWDVSTATVRWTLAMVAAAVIAATVDTAAVTNQWSAAQANQAHLAAPLDAAPAGERFMAADPGAINYLTGRQGLVTPDDDLDTIENLMRAFNVRWLVLEKAQIVPALEPVLAGTLSPEWLSPRPLAVVSATSPAVVTDGAVPGYVPDGALYAVCFSADDTRCQ
jgi:hypothetical protein